jgi:hypothetical protein
MQVDGQKESTPMGQLNSPELVSASIGSTQALARRKHWLDAGIGLDASIGSTQALARRKHLIAIIGSRRRFMERVGRDACGEELATEVA